MTRKTKMIVGIGLIAGVYLISAISPRSLHHTAPVVDPNAAAETHARWTFCMEDLHLRGDEMLECTIPGFSLPRKGEAR
jgi:hypothetical protein